MKSVHLYIDLISNHDEIRKLISQKLYNLHDNKEEYCLALEIIKLQKVMMSKLINPEMELDISTKCNIEEINCD